MDMSDCLVARASDGDVVVERRRGSRSESGLPVVTHQRSVYRTSTRTRARFWMRVYGASGSPSRCEVTRTVAK